MPDDATKKASLTSGVAGQKPSLVKDLGVVGTVVGGVVVIRVVVVLIVGRPSGATQIVPQLGNEEKERKIW